MFSLIDSHCHPHFPQLQGRAELLIAEMETNAVAAALAVATTAAEATTVTALAAAHPGKFYAACGVHPLSAESEEDGEDAIAKNCANKNVIAVGETGLDFFRGRETETMQRNRFAAHIAAARKLQKPLIIHTRESLPQTMDMLAAENARDVGGVLHCYTGDAKQMREAQKINFIVSFTGILTFKNSAAMQETLRAAPPDGYMVETDAPYLAPVPHRGKICTPAMVRNVAEAAAQIRNEPLKKIAANTTKTFHRLFHPPD